MAKLAIKPASTDVTLMVFVQDSASTTGAGKTGIAYNAAGMTAYYARPGAAAVAITLATQTVTGAHSDGGWVEVDATNLPGVYRLDLPDAVCAAGARSAVVMVKGASGAVPLVLEIDLGAEVITATNNDKTGYSLTQNFPANFAALAITAGGAVTVGTVNDKTGYSLSAAGLLAIYDALTEDWTATYNADGTVNVVTLESGYTITHAYTNGRLTGCTVAAP